MTYPSKVGLATARRSGWGIALADLNNDGWKDLLTANSHVTDNVERISSDRYKEPNLSLVNRGGDFPAGRRIRAAGRTPRPRGGRSGRRWTSGCRCHRPRREAGVVAQHYRSERAHWLSVRLRGRSLGARVRAGGQWQEVSAGGGYTSTVVGDVHFGLGAAGETAIEVFWPSGARQSVAHRQGRTNHCGTGTPGPVNEPGGRTEEAGEDDK